ncbi:hypothetical protein HRbin35_00203 [bacterium HR35]|nr:hypothetical protein HRbin35_00203 [bacterium HR35]
MKYLAITEYATEELIKIFAKETVNLPEDKAKDFFHPPEDYLLAIDSPPIFVVADGVTLNFKKLIETNQKYPNPSPAGIVAKIFCEAVIKIGAKKYDNLNEKEIVEIFKAANNEVKKYNEKVGKSEICGNITGFYAATGAFLIIKENKVYWATICDSFVAHFDKDMKLKFISSGNCSPYAVINGEDRMANYLEKGVLYLEKDDRLFVFTDGFENYMKDENFLKIFKDWDDGLREKIKQYSEKMNLQDPRKYGKERSLIAVLFN